LKGTFSSKIFILENGQKKISFDQLLLYPTSPTLISGGLFEVGQ
jgi:hypothetical protein